MSYHQRPHELRLAISAAAEALISDFAGEACAEARRRAEEASSDFLARDWSHVALVDAKREGARRCSPRCFIRRGTVRGRLRDAPFRCVTEQYGARRVVAQRVVRHLERCGFVLMKRPPIGGSAPLRVPEGWPHTKR